jgi:1-acyl-sn-glycerol-3-phosphate acyltransferase
VPASAPEDFDRGERLRLAVQREVTRLLAPVTFVLLWLGLRLVRDHRIEGLADARRQHREIRARSDAPLLICANHLTLIDSFLVAWALGSPAWFLLNFSALPWNVPDRGNFAATRWQRAAIYVLKCIPIQRGGRRTDATRVLATVAQLLRDGQSVLIFPEGGRSRSGRVEIESAATGVGRVIRSVDGCRVLCVYLRGARQETWSALPERGDHFRVTLSEIEPKSDFRGLRASRDLVRQVVGRLQELEREHFDGRQ